MSMCVLWVYMHMSVHLHMKITVYYCSYVSVSEFLFAWVFVRMTSFISCQHCHVTGNCVITVIMKMFLNKNNNSNTQTL